MSQPRLCVIVPGDPRRSGRALWVADVGSWSGWSVTIIGGSSGPRLERLIVGGTRILRVPIQRTLQERSRSGSEIEAGWGRTRVLGRSRSRQDAGTGMSWRLEYPALDDLWLSYRDDLRRLEPDLIHAIGMRVVGVAARTIGESRLYGMKGAWVYDGAVLRQRPRDHVLALRQHESEFAPRADAVIAESDRAAEDLWDRCGLPERPTVVSRDGISQRIRIAFGRPSPGVRRGTTPGKTHLLATYDRVLSGGGRRAVEF